MGVAASLIFIVIYTIFSLGLVMVFSTSSAELLDHARDSGTHVSLIKQLSYALQGVGLAGAVYIVGWRRWLRWSPYLLVIFTFLLAAVFIPNVGRRVNGAYRWLSIGGLSLQPSEFFKYLAPLYLIDAYRRRAYRVENYRDFLRLTIPLFPAVLLILLEPNNGTVAILTIILVALLFLMGIHAKFWALPLLFLCISAAGAIYTLPYVSSRLEVFLYPERDVLGRGHQPIQSKIATGSGGVFGKGPGNSWQKLSYLPEAQNDYIAAIFAEEFGFCGMLLLLVLYMVLLCSIAHLALQAKERSALYLMASVLLIIGMQTFLNLAVVSGLAPSTGLNLPFLSQGGSSLWANLMAMGLFFSAALAEKPQAAILPATSV
jgi:cell division protein FtsW